MASRRKSYRGTEDEHQSVASDNLKLTRGAAKRVRRDLASSDCYGAFNSLQRLIALAAGYNKEAYWAYSRRRTQRVWQRSGAGNAVERTTRSLARKFYYKCVR